MFMMILGGFLIVVGIGWITLANHYVSTCARSAFFSMVMAIVFIVGGALFLDREFEAETKELHQKI